MPGTAKAKTSKPKQRPIQTTMVTLPTYLSPILSHYYDDIWCTPIFDEKVVVQLMVEGFLPIACQNMLLPKLHKERCIIRWPNFHISKSVKKKCKRWSISINKKFEEVVKGCHAQHGISWLYPPIVKAFRAIHSKGMDGMEAMIVRNGNKMGGRQVRLYSIEIYNEESGELVAGELGYAFGNIYTSLTGFSSEDSAGSVQLAALGTLLKHAGFVMWDLGMYLGYKKKIGANLMSRAEFVEEVRKAREEAADIALSCPDFINIKDILCPKQIQSSKKKQIVTMKEENKVDVSSGKRPRGNSPNCVQSLAISSCTEK